MKSILLTGGTGFIGSHTCLCLLERGYFVNIIDSNINSSKVVLKKIKEILRTKNINNFENKLVFFKGDIRDINFLKKVFSVSRQNNRPIEAVIHFAGLKSVNDSFSYPDLYWDVNVYGTIQLIKAMSEFKCSNFIFSSSATVYSTKEESPLYENYDLLPINPYGKTKLTVDFWIDTI